MAKDKKEVLGLTKVLQKIAHKYSFSSVYDDFLKMAICALSMGRMEKEYLQIAGKYSKDELVLFGHALAEMVQEYEQHNLPSGEWRDILGNVFEETNSSFSASGSGQFFTPDSLCNMMAQITAGTEPCDDGIIVNDCASGSGRNLIAHSRLHPLNRYRAFYIAQDLDERCVNMSVLNFFMFGMKGVVIHMNTLSMKIYGGYRIWLADTFMGIKPISVNECYEYLTTKSEPETEPEQPKETPKILNVTNIQQLSMF